MYVACLRRLEDAWLTFLQPASLLKQVKELWPTYRADSRLLSFSHRGVHGSSGPHLRSHTKSKLTTVLAENQRVYRRKRYGRKRDLGTVHPMAMQMRRTLPFRSNRSLCRAPKARRTRLRLSSMLATYIRSVALIPPLDVHRSVTDGPESNDVEELNAGQVTPFIAQTEVVGSRQYEIDRLGGSNSPRQEQMTIIGLESLKQVARHQAENIGHEPFTSLTAIGYELQDLAAWHWVLSANTAMEATRRLATLIKPPVSASNDFAPIPVFVFLRILHRADISLWALHSLIRQVWRVLGSFHQRQMVPGPNVMSQSPCTEKSPGSIGLDELILIIIRLLRHARKVWPASCIVVAQLWIAYANADRTSKRPKYDAATRRTSLKLSFYYNRVLSLLALPSNQTPYRSLHHRQHAQFMVIRQMNAFSPPLIINREGYRAVARVQLAHRKTDRERRWAKLKAMSWPPWKEDKLGMDASIGIEHGISRAFDSLRQMADAGYRSLEWEHAAKTLAGWDTDHSPTIQTRSAIIPRSDSGPSNSVCKLALSAEADALTTYPEILWLARIKATRTLQEAWICFSTCRDRKVGMTPQLYHAMFEKIVYDERRNQRNLQHDEALALRAEDRNPLPGDGREVAESSSSHNQAVFTRERIPTYDQLFDQMTDDHIQPSGRFLAFLLAHARTYKEGVRALQASGLSDAVKHVLMPWTKEPTADVVSLLESLPDWLLAAHIGFLCRSGHIPNAILSMPHDARSPHSPAGKEMYNAVLALRHAFKLVVRRMPFYRPPWNSLFRSLARLDTLVVIKKTPTEYRRARAIPKYHRARRLLEHMDSMALDMDFAGFRSFYTIYKHASITARYVLATSEDYEEKVAMQALLKEGLTFIKARFSQLVRPVDSIDSTDSIDSMSRDQTAVSDPSQPATASEAPALQLHTIPRLTNVPHSADLHAYARFLGQHPSYDDLANLAHWISTYSDDILEEAKQSSNGLAMMRTCLTAVRIFLEQPSAEQIDHEDAVTSQSSHNEDATERLERVRNMIECNEDLGGWPTEEEVEQYLRTGEREGRLFAGL